MFLLARRLLFWSSAMFKSTALFFPVFGRLSLGRLAALAFAVAFFASFESSAAVLMPAYFRDGMVVQRDAPLRIFGDAPADEKVTVEFNGQRKTVRADFKTGKWSIELKPMKASVKPLEMVITQGDAVCRIKNILVGDVWVYACGEFSGPKLQWMPSRGNLIFKAGRSPVRVFAIKGKISSVPLSPVFVSGEWLVPTLENARKMLAAPYLFGKALSDKLGGVPVGVVVIPSDDDVPISSWLDAGTLKKTPAGRSAISAWKKVLAYYPKAKEKYNKAMAKWKIARSKARDAGLPFTQQRPKLPPDKNSPQQPSGVYNTFLFPLKGVAVKGVVWEAGKSGVASPARFKALLPIFIDSFKKFWNDAPLVIVGTGGDGEEQRRPYESRQKLPFLRNMEYAKAQSTPGVEYVSSLDLGWVGIKPVVELARRVLGVALYAAYGKDKFPLKLKIAGIDWDTDKVTLHFSNDGGGLIGRETLIVSGDVTKLIGKRVKRLYSGGKQVLKESPDAGRVVIDVEVGLYDAKGNKIKRLNRKKSRPNDPSTKIFFDNPLKAFFASFVNLTPEEKKIAEEERKAREEEKRRQEEELKRRLEEERKLALERGEIAEPPPPPPPPKPKPKPKPQPKGVIKSKVWLVSTKSALGFALVDSKMRYSWALAKIEGDDLVVKARGMKDPVGIMYAWGDKPKATLFSKDWYPLVFFRAKSPKAKVKTRKK